MSVKTDKGFYGDGEMDREEIRRLVVVEKRVFRLFEANSKRRSASPLG